MKAFHYVLACLTGLGNGILIFCGTTGYEINHFLILIIALLSLGAMVFLLSQIEKKDKQIDRLLDTVLREGYNSQKDGQPSEPLTNKTTI